MCLSGITLHHICFLSVTGDTGLTAASELSESVYVNVCEYTARNRSWYKYWCVPAVFKLEQGTQEWKLRGRNVTEREKCTEIQAEKGAKHSDRWMWMKEGAAGNVGRSVKWARTNSASAVVCWKLFVHMQRNNSQHKTQNVQKTSHNLPRTPERITWFNELKSYNKKTLCGKNLIQVQSLKRTVRNVVVCFHKTTTGQNEEQNTGIKSLKHYWRYGNIWFCGSEIRIFATVLCRDGQYRIVCDLPRKKLHTTRICHFAIIMINSGWWSPLSSSALSQHTAHSPAHPENSPRACLFCISSRGKSGQSETRDGAKCCSCSLHLYLLFVKLSLLMHCFVSVIAFTAAVQRCLSVVGLIQDDLISSCKGRELTLQRLT